MSSGVVGGWSKAGEHPPRVGPCLFKGVLGMCGLGPPPPPVSLQTVGYDVMFCLLIGCCCFVQLAALPFVIMNLVFRPYQRGVYCDDETIQYPLKPDTITHGTLAAVTISCTIVIVSPAPRRRPAPVSVCASLCSDRGGNEFALSVHFSLSLCLTLSLFSLSLTLSLSHTFSLSLSRPHPRRLTLSLFLCASMSKSISTPRSLLPLSLCFNPSLPPPPSPVPPSPLVSPSDLLR